MSIGYVSSTALATVRIDTYVHTQMSALKFHTRLHTRFSHKSIHTNPYLHTHLQTHTDVDEEKEWAREQL